MIDLFIKRYLLNGIRWLYYYINIKRKYKTLKLHYNSYVFNSNLGNYVTIYENVNVTNCEIGSYTFIASQSNFNNTKIGKFCSIGPGIRCGMGTHPSNTFVSTHPIFYSTANQVQVSFADKDYFKELLPIFIGNDVWIGANVIILDGVSIGDGAIIAAGAVVNKNVPPYAIVGGVPARLIRYRFSKEQIDFLLKDQWWNKDENWLRQNFEFMHDVDEYMGKYR